MMSSKSQSHKFRPNSVEVYGTVTYCYAFLPNFELFESMAEKLVQIELEIKKEEIFLTLNKKKGWKA